MSSQSAHSYEVPRASASLQKPNQPVASETSSNVQTVGDAQHQGVEVNQVVGSAAPQAVAAAAQALVTQEHRSSTDSGMLHALDRV